MLPVTLCRLCGALDTLSLEVDDQLRRQINEQVPTKLAQVDGLPNTVCQRCRAHLTRHAEFMKVCTETESEIERRLRGGRVIGKAPPGKIDRASQSFYEEKDENIVQPFTSQSLVPYTVLFHCTNNALKKLNERK